MIPVPGHPFASYRIDRGSGEVFIVCYCSACGARYERRCTRPSYATTYVAQFATIHGHGYSPRVQARS